LSLYTVYDHPKDYPTKYVVRRFVYDQPTSDVWLYDNLEAARLWLLARGLVCLRRHPHDDPVILETWL